MLVLLHPTVRNQPGVLTRWPDHEAAILLKKGNGEPNYELAKDAMPHKKRLTQRCQGFKSIGSRNWHTHDEEETAR